MGNEYSMQRSRNSTFDGRNEIHQFMNNLHPLRFHPVHGENVTLSRNSLRACRSEGFCKGIAFSNRPVLVNEYIWIKFTDISSSWSGALRIGFTSSDPMNYRNKLPRYACPCMTDISGNWARALAERHVKKDTILYYYVDQNGDVHYGLDNEDRGIFFSGVDTSNKLWALLDIYGNTTTIEFIDPRSITRRELTRNQSAGSSSKCDFNIVDVIVDALSFHSTHGKNITLNKDRHIATRRTNSLNHSYVFTERCLQLGEILIIKILQVDDGCSGSLHFGVTSCDPLNITSHDLPSDFSDLFDRPEYWVINRETEECNVGDFLMYFINSKGAIKRYKNRNQLLPDIFVDHTLPLWFFVILYSSVSEIELLGTTNHLLGINGEGCSEYSKESSVSTLQLTGNTSLPNKPNDPSGECVICYEKNVNSVLYRCGHMCMCHECALKLFHSGPDAQCPICRKLIHDVIKTYN